MAKRKKKKKNTPCQELPQRSQQRYWDAEATGCHHGNTNHFFKEERAAWGQPGASQLSGSQSVEDRRASSNATSASGGWGGGDRALCPSHIPRALLLHLHSLWGRELLGPSPGFPRRWLWLPQPENCSTELLNNFLRTHEATLVCVLWPRVRERGG